MSAFLDMEDDALERAYQAALLAASILGAERRQRRERQRKIMAAIFAATPCGDIHPDYAGCTHECYVPPDVEDEIARGGE